MPKGTVKVARCRVWMVAAECQGLAKVGGLADVVHDLSQELTRQGHDVRILMPAYGQLADLSPPRSRLTVAFAGEEHEVCTIPSTVGEVPVDLLHCPDFFQGDYGSVYFDSAAQGRGPYEDDAARFAFFSAAVATLLLETPAHLRPTVLHCHDWHTGALLLLLRRAPQFSSLARMPVLFTIHNLDYQGQRPLEGPGRTSLSGWFPAAAFTPAPEAGSEITDPATPDCFNPMRTAIELADTVNTVSPNYAEEITRPDAPETNFIGGRGLETLLARCAKEGRLAGLLNGISYDLYDPGRLTPPFGPDTPGWRVAKRAHKEALRHQLRTLVDAGPEDIAGGLLDLDKPVGFGSRPLVVAVTRMAAQKMSLLAAKSTPSLTQELATLDANFLILGTGELSKPLLANLRDRATNVLHIARFDALLADLMYCAGDFFLMPSSFEPCGISQMIAMAYGTLPIVTPVGGLVDTVSHGETGFVVATLGAGGGTLAQALFETLAAAVKQYYAAPLEVERMALAAMSVRYSWAGTAREYGRLYRSITQGPCT